MQRRTFLGATALAARAWPAHAQSPGNTVIWSGFPAGGLGDMVTRPLLEQLRGKTPQNLVYDSKPGAGGRIAAEFVKRAAPDGHTLLQSPAGVLTLHPHVFKKLNYEPLTDFVAVAGLCSYTYAFTAGPGVPAQVRTVADYLAWAKAHPTQAHYGIPSTGTALHMAGMLLARGAGLALNPIPYKGGGPLLTDLLGGQVPVSFNVLSEVLPHVASGKLRVLAVTSPTRWKALPDTPTLQELGYKDIAFVEWLGWFAPAATPVARLAALNAAVSEQIRTPAMAEVFQRNALEPFAPSGGAMPALAALLQKDHADWKRVVRTTGFTPED
ncbi:tripartite tricarboxylate transporter substrate-binding protein [Acidovorax sp. CCYZU-2555]|uniref:Bug family tripartite tricarboxylate transporter substrate binding protein n=1 Tax=Acidovorax sp. CCYZU-2555 TaxID=2835042 RepID=UPI001BCB2B49|nr:tripartite tricarboxylate transporter substrate-binding protein [Acidovorax sp. CCYZU-2555]MBS7781385.1 twin-arginine translocation pathway signal protein [Acidovorax sp. CCYZU-2555]